MFETEYNLVPTFLESIKYSYSHSYPYHISSPFALGISFKFWMVEPQLSDLQSPGHNFANCMILERGDYSEGIAFKI